MSNSIPVRRRHLIIQLKKLRSGAGLSQEAVSREMGWDRQKILRIEAGRFQRINSADVVALCKLYGASEEESRELVEIALQARKHKPWWFRYKEVFPGPFVSLEAEATQIQDFTIGLVPGLFQTRAYISALIARSADIAEDEAVQRIDFRMERQASVLERDSPPAIWSIIDEAALRRKVGGAKVMKEQIAHLCELGKRRNINIQVLPFEAGAHAGGTVPFLILGFEGGTDSVVYIESPGDGFYLEAEEEIARHRLVFDRVQATAMSVEDSADFLAALV
ncbi:helix-turn-helix domain-containing protein [Nocardiopsis sp. CNT-189]|uniref:helix-turn-helix domain-containing protein n=1 Tax=Nocardiopsis oceanisediminis TaxID=2816862 RepID=UPI003B38CAB4